MFEVARNQNRLGAASADDFAGQFVRRSPRRSTKANR
jgi:hypothetical protein